MDEIICSECGRPNLVEAVKCWYCQEPFEKRIKEEKMGGDSNPDQPKKNNPDHTGQEGVQKPQKEIPDWLRRVRELRQSDEETEEQKEQWQQEVLFNAQKDSKRGKRDNINSINQTNRSSSQKKSSVTDTSIQEPLIKQSDTGQSVGTTNQNVQTHEEPPEDPEDLPEGFTRLPKEGD